MIAVDLSKQQALDANPKAIQQINFTANLDRAFYQYKMMQYNSNVKLSNSQLNKLKSAIKNWTEVVLRLLTNMIGNSNDKTNCSHELLLTNKQVANVRKAFPNNSATDIRLSKA